MMVLSPSALHVALHTKAGAPRPLFAKSAWDPIILRNMLTASTPSDVPTNLQMHVAWMTSSVALRCALRRGATWRDVTWRDV